MTLLELWLSSASSFAGLRAILQEAVTALGLEIELELGRLEGDISILGAEAAIVALDMMADCELVVEMIGCIYLLERRWAEGSFRLGRKRARGARGDQIRRIRRFRW